MHDGISLIPDESPCQGKAQVLDKLKAAILQMCAGQIKSENLKTAEKLIERAIAKGANFVCLPERFNFYGPQKLNGQEAEALTGKTCQLLQGLAGKYKVNIIGGSILEKSDVSGRYFNTTPIIDRNGNIIGKYRKMHLFDIDSPDLISYNESAEIQPGREPGFFSMDGIQFGVAICYDLRFPELFRHLTLKGAEIFFIPSAFFKETGKLHWEILVRARAIENQCFVVASDQCGKHPGQPDSFGESLIVGPEGGVLSRLGAEEGIAACELDLEKLRRMRKEHPILNSINRKFLGLAGER